MIRIRGCGLPRIAVIYAQEFGIAAMRWLPVRNAEAGSTISLLIKCNASGDTKQIRETVDTSRLHARVEHNPNFGCGSRRSFSSLMLLTNNYRVSLFRSVPSMAHAPARRR